LQVIRLTKTDVIREVNKILCNLIKITAGNEKCRITGPG
jgi:hypothetical protein